MAVALATDLDPLAEAGGHRERLVFEIQHAHEDVSRSAGQQPPAGGVVGAAHGPGAALPEREQRVFDPMAFEHGQHPIQGISLGDAPQIHDDPGVCVADDAVVADLDVSPADPLARDREFAGIRNDIPCSGLDPELDQRPDGNVEAFVSELRELRRSPEQSHQVWIGRSPLTTSVRVQSAEGAVGIGDRQQLTQSFCLGEEIGQGGATLRLVVDPKDHLEHRTHDVAAIADRERGFRRWERRTPPQSHHAQRREQANQSSGRPLSRLRWDPVKTAHNAAMISAARLPCKSRKLAILR